VIEGEGAGWVRRFGRERRGKLQRWIFSQLKGSARSFDSEVFAELELILREVEEE
jgi:hypothetical protein